MKKNFLMLSCVIVAVLMLLSLSLAWTNGLFSEIKGADNLLRTGKVDINIEEIEIEKESANRQNLLNSSNGDPLSGGTIKLNSITSLHFIVKNYGNVNIEYKLNIGIFFDDDLHEAGKFLLYPYYIDNVTIKEDIKNQKYEYALIERNVSDDNVFTTSYGQQKGIFVEIATDELSDYIDDSIFKVYDFKILFLNDNEIDQNLNFFDARAFEIVLNVMAQLKIANSNWSSEKNEFLRFVTKTDFSIPIIEEIASARTFYIDQAKEIDLASYAKASDLLDGDITNSIVISSYPNFNPNKAGTYIIEYNVTNSNGIAAIPLEISITIWDFIKVESGNYHSVALSSHGKVYTWGYNLYGQLGDGSIANSAIPKIVDNLNNIVDVAAGDYCSYALDSDGQVYAWGINTNGRLGDGTTTIRYRPVKVSQEENVKFVAIAAGFRNAGAITENGDVYTWGYGGYGALGNEQITDSYQPIKLNITNVKKISLGYYNGAVITNTGDVYTWGDNLHGQLGTGSEMVVSVNGLRKINFFSLNNIKIKDISVGWYHMVAIASTGELYTWGYGAEGRLGNNNTGDKNTPQYIKMSEKAFSCQAGFFNSAVLMENKNVYLFGQNGYGKLGTGNVINQYTPVLLNFPEEIKDISLGYDSSFILTETSIVYGMGYGGTGVLGSGNNNNSLTLVKWAFVAPKPY